MIMSNKLKPVAIVIALIVGFTLGSLDQLSRLGASQQPQSQLIDGRVNSSDANRASEMHNGRDSTGRPNIEVHEDTPDASTADSYSNDTIFLPGNVTMAPLRENGVFVGYEILSVGSDDRLSASDVITSLNGIPVEDSAAGSELVIAALTNQKTRIELLDQ